MGTCSVAGCDRKVASGGLCGTHRYRKEKGIPLNSPIKRKHGRTPCSVEGCTTQIKCEKLCHFHWRRKMRGAPMKAPRYFRTYKPEKKKCKITKCENWSRHIGFCTSHYARWYRGLRGKALTKPFKIRAPDGSGYVAPNGYRQIYVNGNPHAEHRFKIAEKIGRPLKRHESVHHKNGNRSDNRLANLELWSSSQPPGQRVKDKVKWAKEILKLYG